MELIDSTASEQIHNDAGYGRDGRMGLVRIQGIDDRCLSMAASQVLPGSCLLTSCFVESKGLLGEEETVWMRMGERK